MRFNKYLIPEERIEAWKTGITYKLAEKEVLPSEFNGMCKQAQMETAPLPLKLILWSALLGGGALGVGSHLVGNEMQKGDMKIREKKRTREYYRDMVARLKQELENQELA